MLKLIVILVVVADS